MRSKNKVLEFDSFKSLLLEIVLLRKKLIEEETEWIQFSEYTSLSEEYPESDFAIPVMELRSLLDEIINKFSLKN